MKRNKIKFVVSAAYSVDCDQWTGFSVELNKKGTHDTYNVVYNGVCINEHFPTERKAKKAARKARKTED